MGSKTDKGPSQVLELIHSPASGTTVDQHTADRSLSAAPRNALSAKPWAELTFGRLGINEVVEAVESKADAAAGGDLAEAKRMLMAQAIALDAVFTDMTRRAASLVKVEENGSWSIHGHTLELLLRVGFKAQMQSRATLQTLGELVNPRAVAFIKQAPGSQANVTSGPQQVNGAALGVGAGAPPASERKNGTNKLLEATPSERLDTGTTQAASGANQKLETVGAVHRADDAGGQVRRFPKRDQARRAKRG